LASPEGIKLLIEAINAERRARALFNPYKAVFKDSHKICTVNFRDEDDVCEIIIDFEDKVLHTKLENLIPLSSLSLEEFENVLEKDR
jgi:hypothetical protein